MRLLCDANIGRRLSEILADSGHDVVRSLHHLPASAPDVDVLAFAVRDQRVLITCDADFGTLVFLDGKEPPPAVVYVRFEPEDVENIAPRLNAVLSSDIENHMIVIGPLRDRMTRFPEKS